MDDLDLHHEIERLCSALREANDSIARKDVEIATIEAKFHEDNERLSIELSRLRERYDRLLANHQHLSKLNHELEAKLLQTIENTTTEKKVMADQVEAMKTRLAEAERQLALIKSERDRYKEDCSIAVNLLQTNPDKFYPQCYQSLPSAGIDPSCPTREPSQPTAARFPTFLPTFPPICLSSMIPLKPTLAPQSSPSDKQSQEPCGNLTINCPAQYPNASDGYLRNKGAVVTHL